MAYSKQSGESKPEFSFTESNDKVTFVLVIDGLKIQSFFASAKNGFKAMPSNAKIVNQILTLQSINYAIEMIESGKVYRFQIKRLPSKIHPDKTKVKYEKDRIIVTLFKTENETWKQFVETDFETAHLVKN